MFNNSFSWYEWDWKITDFWWSYSQWRDEEEKKKQKKIEKSKNVNKSVIEEDDATLDDLPLQKLPFEAQQELDQLIKDLEKLEEEKAEITQLLNNKDLAYDDISLLSEHLWEITKTIARKEARRFELLES